MRYVMRIATPRESSKFWTHIALPGVSWEHACLSVSEIHSALPVPFTHVMCVQVVAGLWPLPKTESNIFGWPSLNCKSEHRCDYEVTSVTVVASQLVSSSQLFWSFPRSIEWRTKSNHSLQSWTVITSRESVPLLLVYTLHFWSQLKQEDPPNLSI